MSREEFYKKCRNDYSTFIYKGFSSNLKEEDLSITYDFSIEGLSEFHPTWIIPRINKIKDFDENLLNELIFSLGMVELISYWKISCPPNVIINNRKLNLLVEKALLVWIRRILLHQQNKRNKRIFHEY